MCAVAPTRQPLHAPGRASHVPARRPGYPLRLSTSLSFSYYRLRRHCCATGTIIDDRTLSRLRSSADCEARDEALRSESQAGALTRLIRSRSAAVVSGDARGCPLNGRGPREVKADAGLEVDEEQGCGLVRRQIAEAVEHVVAGVIRPPQLAALDAYKAWCAAAMGRIGAVGRVHGAEEEGIGTGDERGVFGNEVVVTFDVPGDCAFDVFEVASLNVLGTVAECLLNSQLESVGARACEGAVHPNPAPGGEFDGKHANGLTWREALQWITATRRSARKRLMPPLRSGVASMAVPSRSAWAATPARRWTASSPSWKPLSAITPRPIPPCRRPGGRAAPPPLRIHRSTTCATRSADRVQRPPEVPPGRP